MTHSHAADEPDHVHRAEPIGARTSRTMHGKFNASESRQARRLVTVLAIISGFFVLELVGALMAESVVLQADALHLLTDVLALGVSLAAMRLAVRRPTLRFTFGLRRAEPVAAIFSAVLVLGTTAGVVLEAVSALHSRTPPRAGLMIVVAVMALVVNGLSAWLLHDVIGHAHPHACDANNPDDAPKRGGPPDGPNLGPRARGHALNLRGAWLHLIGDTLGALAALCAAIVIRFGGYAVADPIASFVVAAILLFGSLRLLRDATLVLLEAAPPHLSVTAIERLVIGFPGVIAVHDLHVWSLGGGHDAITLHVRTNSLDPAFGARLSQRIRATMHVEYVTVQVETGNLTPD
ncbi:MAG: cation diffusion facilitator family transporter [Myxococcota bacterium]|nr:cation diffusion facilitator family transporter [Myxococcota bacterium]